MQIKKTEDK